MTKNTAELPAAVLDDLVEYNAPSITIHRYDELQATLADSIKKYEGLIVTPETVSDARKAKAELNAIITKLENRRKEIKRDYNKPLKEFEDKVKVLTASVKAVITPIDEKIKELDEIQREHRTEIIISLINEMAPNYDVDPAKVVIEDDWLAKNLISEKTDKPSLKLQKLIASDLETMQLKSQRLASDRTALITFAKANSLEASGWLVQLTNGTTFEAMKPQLESAILQRDRQAEAEKLAKESADAIAKMEQEQVGEKTVNRETGEIVQAPSDDDAPELEIITRQLEVKGTKDDLWDLANFMKTHHIEYHGIEVLQS